jgi:hypothetical protein
VNFVDLIVDVHRHLDRAAVGHAFGGALALGYVGRPRGTVDIDVNVFLAPEALGVVDRALAPLGYSRSASEQPPVPAAGVRYDHATEPFPLDAFPSLNERYATVEARVEQHPFGRGGEVLPFLSAEDLAVFKLSFGRPQDWVDLQAIAAARPGLDVDYVEEQLVALRGPTMYPRVARLRSFFR